MALFSSLDRSLLHDPIAWALTWAILTPPSIAQARMTRRYLRKAGYPHAGERMSPNLSAFVSTFAWLLVINRYFFANLAEGILAYIPIKIAGDYLLLRFLSTLDDPPEDGEPQSVKVGHALVAAMLGNFVWHVTLAAIVFAIVITFHLLG